MIDFATVNRDAENFIEKFDLNNVEGQLPSSIRISFNNA